MTGSDPAPVVAVRRRPDQRAGLGARIAGAAVAAALVAAVLALAGPVRVWTILASCDPFELALAAVTAGAAFAVRGLRLALLLPAGELGLARGATIATASQAAVVFVPLRAGEMALPALLRRHLGCDFASAVGVLLVARTLDLAALGAWALVALLALGGVGAAPIAAMAVLLLLAPPLLLPIATRAADSLAVRLLAPRGRRGRRWARRVRRVEHAVAGLRSRPLRLAAASAASVATWGVVWLLTWLLLRSVGLFWPWLEVVAGSAGASIANLAPFNLVANLGTLESGWTAAFSALGVPLATAAASGLAIHLLSLVLTAAYGALAWALLSFR